MNSRTRYKMVIAYEGTQYCGWQRQPNALSIQELIEKALGTLCKTPLTLHGSSRTDAGVHALAQVAHFTLENPIDTRKLLYSLNGLLPHDIRIKALQEVPITFHARFHAKRKVYHYHLHCEPFHEPWKRHYSHHIKHSFHLESLQKAIPYFIGTHNFKAFANENDRGSAKNSPFKTLYDLRLVEEPGGYRLEFEGSGFLYKMVRNIVGTLLACSRGKLAPEEIPSILASQDRKKAPQAAPALGLFLVRIDYELS
ncbi:MAG: tRNA pseudouridine(38-40) synthase TruA [Chlamydiae bacterium]|nr:tRNA pseudouridine(38-40) synthase TruA [Chlamydiota bacterium]